MLDRVEGEVDIESRPPEMAGARAEDIRELSHGGLSEPGKLLEREVVLSTINQNQHPVG